MQLTRALDQIATLPGTPPLRREQIRLQVALITPLIHVKGYAAPETKAAAERARVLVDEAERDGESLETSLLLSVLYSTVTTNIVDFNGDLLRPLAAQFLALAQKEGTTGSLLTAHRAMGASLLYTGHVVESLPHLERTLALYNPAEHRVLAVRFGQDARPHTLCYRSLAFWLLGYPEAALADADYAISDAREIGQAGTLMGVLALTSLTHILCGNRVTAETQTNELVSLADEKNAAYWRAFGIWMQGWLWALTGKAAEAVQMLNSGMSAWRSTGATLFAPTQWSSLAAAHASLNQFDDAQRSISVAMTAMETSKETWFDAEVNRMAGVIALMSAEPDAGKAEEYFERALSVARQQQAKSWELRAAMSMARFWRDHGKRNEARELLAPVYGWFTEGFETRDLKEAKALLDELPS